MWETWAWSLGRADPLEKELATHSNTFAWKIPWMEEPGRLQSMGLQRAGHNWAASLVQHLTEDFSLKVSAMHRLFGHWLTWNQGRKLPARIQQNWGAGQRQREPKQKLYFSGREICIPMFTAVFWFYSLLCGILIYPPVIWTTNIGQKNQLHWNTSVNCKTEGVWTWRALLQSYSQQPRWKQPVSTNESMDKEDVKKST